MEVPALLITSGELYQLHTSYFSIIFDGTVYSSEIK